MELRICGGGYVRGSRGGMSATVACGSIRRTESLVSAGRSASRQDGSHSTMTGSARALQLSNAHHREKMMRSLWCAIFHRRWRWQEPAVGLSLGGPILRGCTKCDETWCEELV